MSIRSLADLILEGLESRTDEERRRLASTYYPTSLQVLGCTNPAMKEVFNLNKQEFRMLDADAQWEVAFELLDTRIFEAQQLAFMLIHASPRAMKSMTATRLETLGGNLDNWVSVDTYSVWFSGFAWRTGTIGNEEVMSWTGSHDRWVRRKALVSTVALNQRSHGGRGDVPRTLMVCEALLEDRNDLIVKAMSWALRELTKTSREAVIGFMEKHKDQIAPRVRREVSTKLTTGRKQV